MEQKVHSGTSPQQHPRLTVEIPCDIIHLLHSIFHCPPSVFPRFEGSLGDYEEELRELIQRKPMRNSRSLCSTANERSTITEMDMEAAELLVELKRKGQTGCVQSCRLVDIQSSWKSVKDRNSVCSDAQSFNLCSGDQEQEELGRGTRRGKRHKPMGREENVDELDRRERPRFKFVSEILLSSSM
eukprot:Gb_26141 [translate_table: standard]